MDNLIEKVREAIKKAKILIGAQNDTASPVEKEANIYSAWHVLNEALAALEAKPTDAPDKDREAALINRLSADIEYLDDTYADSKRPPDGISIDYEFGNLELTLGDLKTIRAALTSAPSVPDFGLCAEIADAVFDYTKHHDAHLCSMDRYGAAKMVQAMLAAAPQPAAPSVPDGLLLEWRDGEPPHPWNKEWFIAITTYGDRVVLKALPEEYTYDYKTADETYIKADKIKKWMQFPDSDYIAPVSQTATEILTKIQAVQPPSLPKIEGLAEALADYDYWGASLMQCDIEPIAKAARAYHKLSAGSTTDGCPLTEDK